MQHATQQALVAQQDGLQVGQMRKAMGLADEVEVDKGPQPYGGKVYPGMPVRPRGLGTPRGDRLSGEVYRSAQTGAETPYGDGRQWGRFLTQKTHYTVYQGLIKPDE